VTGLTVELIKQRIKENWIFLAIVILVFLADRTSKNYVINFFLTHGSESYYYNSFLNFVLLWNTGMAFGIFESDSYTHYGLSFLIFLVIVFLVVWLIKSNKKLEKISIAFIIGGALGNWFDRIVYNAVPDFIDLHYLDFHWFVFNVSDIVISVGILLLILSDFFLKKNEQ